MRYFSQKTRIFIFGALSGSCFGALFTLSVYEQYAVPYEERELIEKPRREKSLLEKKCAMVGYPSSENVRVTTSFVSAFSPFLRTPLWVMEYFSKDMANTNSNNASASRDKSAFQSEKSISQPFRSTNTEYHTGVGLGLSRGHLAPAQMHKNSQKELDDTFNLSLNIVPQLMSTNGCDWFRLEQMAKNLVRHYDESWVITGPAFLPDDYIIGERGNKTANYWTMTYNLISEKRIAVPTHLFKVILGKNASMTPHYQCAAFIMPNKPIAEEVPMTAYQVELGELESLTGLNFFPELTAKKIISDEQEKPLAITTRRMPLLASSSSHEMKDMCQVNVCEGSYGSFSKMFRHLSKMQKAQSLESLQELWTQAQSMGYAKRLEKDYILLRKAILEKGRVG